MPARSVDSDATVLLDDAIRLARQAATADVEITLGVPHVFETYHAILDEAKGALDGAVRFLSAHLAAAERAAEAPAASQLP